MVLLPLEFVKFPKDLGENGRRSALIVSAVVDRYFFELGDDVFHDSIAVVSRNDLVLLTVKDYYRYVQSDLLVEVYQERIVLLADAAAQQLLEGFLDVAKSYLQHESRYS